MKQDGKKWTSLAALLVFTLFAVCLLLVLLTGAGVYRRLSENGGARYTQATAAQYIATRCRQGRNLSVEDFEGTEALTFAEDFGGVTYLTRVYLYDGWLMELFSAEAAQLSPEDGEKILQADQVDFEWEDNGLTFTLDGEVHCLTLREGKVVPHAQ